MAGGIEENVIAGLSRDQLVSRFEEWLDNAFTAEHPPEGIEAEILSALTSGESEHAADQTSSYALWAAMTALSQEVKLQGRAFKELAATLDSQPARIGDEIRAAYREREHDIQREAERRCRKEILGSLIDLRDRLERGLQSAKQSAAEISRASGRGWRARLFGNPSADLAQAPLAAVIRGYELGLECLDQILESFNARSISALGQSFDPRRMNAIDRQESQAVPEGTVLDVYRTGYEWNGDVFRPAQVKVSVQPKGLNKNE
jgi:molecular chaperone GrpE